MKATRRAMIAVLMLVQACAAPRPLTMPPADGRGQMVAMAPGTYVVNRQDRGAPRPGIYLRVTRVNGRDMDYSDLLRAKAVATAYCATYHREIDPRAALRFSAPNSWIFDGDCR